MAMMLSTVVVPIVSRVFTTHDTCSLIVRSGSCLKGGHTNGIGLDGRQFCDAEAIACMHVAHLAAVVVVVVVVVVVDGGGGGVSKFLFELH